MRLSLCALFVLALSLCAHQALASDLYSLDSNAAPGTVYKLNQSTGAETLVGPVGAAVFIGVYLAMQVWSPAGLFPSFTSIQGDVEDANRIYRMGGLGEVSAFRLREIPLILPLHVYVFPRTVGLFLFGAFAWRSGVLRMPHQVLLFLTGAACIGLGAFLVLPGSGVSFAAVGIGRLASPVGTLVLALGERRVVVTEAVQA